MVNHQRQQRLDRIAQINANIEQAFAEQQAALLNNQADLSQGRYFHQFVWRLKAQREVVEAEIAKIDQILRKMQEDLKQAMIKQKSLEKLREKAQRQHQKHMHKLEDDFLGELALFQHARR